MEKYFVLMLLSCIMVAIQKKCWLLWESKDVNEEDVSIR